MVALLGVSLLSILGFGFLIATGLFHVARVPGLHFDEAWAANYAYRILTERGFFPLDAMSPYTHPWAHYLTAVFFHFFGTDLFVYRAAGVAMNFVGALFAWIALMRSGEKRAAGIFPFLLAFFIPFVLNERFTIEITSFLILCLGLLILGAQMRSITLVFIASFFGVTSHLLFLAPVLGLLAVWGLQSGRWQLSHRLLVLVTAVGLWPFLWKVYEEIPEKDKAAFLLAADSLVIVFVALFEQMPRNIRRMRETFKLLVGICSIPFMLYIVFFSEGHWSILFTYGRIVEHWVLWISVPMTLIGFVFLVRLYLRNEWAAPERRFWSWLLYTLFFTGILAVKPTPRYFDLVFFMMAVGAAILLARAPWRKSLAFVWLFVALGSFVLVENYWTPGLRGEGVDRSYRFLFFHDNSSDPLPKQDLVRYLGNKGCAYSQVKTLDSRLGESLLFLSRGDWVVAPDVRCPAATVWVQRAADGTPQDPHSPHSENFEAFRISWR